MLSDEFWGKVMVFNFFKKRQEDDSSEQFAYFSSKKELDGLTAIPLKKNLEARQEVLIEKAKTEPLSQQEQLERKQIQAQIQELLQSGQSSQQLPRSLAVSQSDTDSLSNWTDDSHKQDRILLVEDDGDLSEMLRFCLEREFAEVIVFRDGRDAEAWIQTHPAVDVVSLDLMLPRSDGFRLIQLIREQPSWKKTPILVVSSKSDSATIQKALAYGANEYLQKPIQPQTYIARLKKLVSGSH